MSNASFDVPMELSVYYFACNDEAGWCIPVTQTYAIRLEVDRDGGQARRSGGNGFGRQRGGFNRRGSGFGGGGGFAGRGGFGANQSPEMMVERMLLMGDWDGDDRISRDEAPEQMLRQFERMDANGDGFADKDELMQMTQRQLQRQPQPR
jgi:collagen type III alpha